MTLIPDRLGSIVGTLDSAGSLTRAGYQAFGQNTVATTGSFRYTAQRFDPETAAGAAQPSGLYYFRARMYSPTWGRFLQPDPVGYAAGTNLYAYVANDPLNGTDPTGLDWQTNVGAGFTVAVAGGVGASLSAGINIPSNPLHLGGYQVFASAQGNEMLGPGLFVGYGLQANFSKSNGPLPAFGRTDSGAYEEADLGLGAAGGGGFQASGQPGVLGGPPIPVSQMTGGSAGIPVRFGAGLGGYVGTGSYGSATFTVPSVDQINDMLTSAVGSMINSTYTKPSSSGPSK